MMVSGSVVHIALVQVMLSESSLSALFPPTPRSPPLQDSAGTVQLTNSGGQTSVPEYMQFMIDMQYKHVCTQT